MDIRHDRFYISVDDRSIIAHGYGIELPNSLNFSFQYTEEELIANRKRRERCTPEEWDTLCRREAKRKSEAVHAVMDVISKEFVCYQYDPDRSFPYRDQAWELFFWCNSFFNTMRGSSMDGRDYSDTRLSFNSEHNVEKRLCIYKRVLELVDAQFKAHPNLHLVVQYKLQKDQEKIDAAVDAILPQMIGRPCCYGQMSGKIIKTEQGVFFQKKYARTKGYSLDNYRLLLLYWAQFEDEEVKYGTRKSSAQQELDVG